MPYRYVSSLAFATAQYAAGITKRARRIDGEWVPGTGTFFLLELEENYAAMLKAEPVAMQRYMIIAGFLREVPASFIDPATRSELVELLITARKTGVAYYTDKGAEATCKKIIRQAAVRITKDLHHMKTTGA